MQNASVQNYNSKGLSFVVHLQTIFKPVESRLKFVHAMLMYVFSKFQNKITSRGTTFFIIPTKIPGSCHSLLSETTKK